MPTKKNRMDLDGGDVSAFHYRENTKNRKSSEYSHEGSGVNAKYSGEKNRSRGSRHSDSLMPNQPH